ncbi:MAG TPA: GNAT family N-acetyltransferase [Polyangia bacterium]|nr:GNAT family N-acetyltransferase [Polyangia bacterium]
MADAAPARARAERLAVTWTAAPSDEDGRAYDAFVARAAGGHYAQSRAWAPLACAGRPYASRFVLVRGEGGRVVGAAHVLRVRVAGVPLPVAVVERGPVVDDPARFGDVLAAVVRAARRRGVARLSVMPYWERGTRAVVEALRDGGWRDVQRASGAHVATLRIAFEGEGELFPGAERRALRNKLRLAEKAGATARRGTRADVARFAELHGALMQRQGLRRKAPAWLAALAARDFEPRGDVGLFFTECEGRTLAVALLVRHGSLVTYALGATDETPVKFAKMLPALAAGAAWARDVGAVFDLGGVPMAGDDDAKRASIAQFKQEFSKTRVELVGEHARWLF